MKIPVQNVYYLLCYAWNKLEEGEVVDVTGIESTELADLFASVLNGGVAHLLRRGLDRGYLVHAEDTARLRGRIHVTDTLARCLEQRGQAHCSFDELSHDMPHNQIIKGTLRVLMKAEELDAGLRRDLANTYRRFHAVASPPLTKRLFRRVQLHRNNSYYDFLLKVCELVVDNLLVSERAGPCRFRDFVRDERRMAQLFEAFVRNFYRLEQSRYTAAVEYIQWDERSGSDSGTLLPVMKTDVSLTGAHDKLVIDTKFYKEALQEHWSTRTFWSDHLYQLHAYLSNLAVRGGVDASASGMLLYPAVGDTLDEHVNLLGHDIYVRTVNLDQPWFAIRRDLLSFLPANVSPS